MLVELLLFDETGDFVERIPYDIGGRSKMERVAAKIQRSIAFDEFKDMKALFTGRVYKDSGYAPFMGDQISWASPKFFS